MPQKLEMRYGKHKCTGPRALLGRGSCRTVPLLKIQLSPLVSLVLTVSLWCYALPAGAAEEAGRVHATGVQVAPTAPGRNRTATDTAAIHSKGKQRQAHRYLLQRDPSSVQGKSWLAKNNGWPLK